MNRSGILLLASALASSIGCETGASVDASHLDGGADLSQLDGESYTLEVDRIANNPDVQFPLESLQEADYEATDDGNRYEVRFSAIPETVTISGRPAGEAPVILTGTIVADDEELRRYGVDEVLFAGGRFDVWIADDHFEAELTVYGTGIPIIRSERGRLAADN